MVIFMEFSNRLWRNARLMEYIEISMRRETEQDIYANI